MRSSTSARTLARLVASGRRNGIDFSMSRLARQSSRYAGDVKGKGRQLSQEAVLTNDARLLHHSCTARSLLSCPLRRTSISTATSSLHNLILATPFSTTAFRPNTAAASSSTAASSSSPSSTPSPTPPPLTSPFPIPNSGGGAFAGLGTTQLSPDIMLRCTIFDSTGSATSTSGVFKKSRLCSDHGLEPRDLRKIDSRVPNLVPTILARRGGILVNILHIRAMIKADKVLLFDSYGSTDSQLHSAFVYNLQHNLRPHTGPAHHNPANGSNGAGLAYEFRALESILVSVLDALRIELGVVRGWTRGILEDLDDDVDREKLRTLLQVSRKLNAFLSRAKAVKGAVVEVLENEEDMSLMYLSSASPNSTSSTTSSSNNASSTPASSPSSSSPSSASINTSTPPDVDTHYTSTNIDELELLLESFDKQVEEVVAETTQLHSDISNTQEVVELILDNNRNKLLALDLKTSIVTMGISAGTLWAGLFGMNLKSHMEEAEWAFLGVSGVAVVAVAVVCGVGLRRLERLRRVGLGQGQGKVKKGRNWLERVKGKKSVVEGGGMGMGGIWTPINPGIGYHMPMYSQHPLPAPPSGDQHHSISWWPNPFHPSPPSSDTLTNPTQPNPPQTPPSTSTPLGMGLGSKWNNSTGKKRRSKSSS
ncbi:related to LPE10 - strong similarity to Mrs2p [Ustilago trichophora]|uniref:Magnesium transporter n=1 Tax=Ustilago trichophora TaxID=86804 RepID=A0A5C3EE84_9BASI|nr:related to LPE10 - strong similarity to Mrs2p [Ustilago trichophora]